MLTNKIGSERLTFPNNSKNYIENKMTKSSLSLNIRTKNKKNMTQQNSAKRDEYLLKEAKNKKKPKNYSK
jgi:hypothetical protein